MALRMAAVNDASLHKELTSEERRHHTAIKNYRAACARKFTDLVVNLLAECREDPERIHALCPILIMLGVQLALGYEEQTSARELLGRIDLMLRADQITPLRL